MASEPVGDHTRTGYVSYNFRSRKMSADSRFCALSHFDFNCRRLRSDIFHEHQSVRTLPVQSCFFHSNKNLHADRLLPVLYKIPSFVAAKASALCAL